MTQRKLKTGLLVTLFATFCVWGYWMAIGDVVTAEQRNRASDYFPALSDKTASATWFAELGSDLVAQEQAALQRLGKVPENVSDRELRNLQHERQADFAVSDAWITKVKLTPDLTRKEIDDLLMYKSKGFVTVSEATGWMAGVSYRLQNQIASSNN